jgi:hypothetical protein
MENILDNQAKVAVSLPVPLITERALEGLLSPLVELTSNIIPAQIVKLLKYVWLIVSIYGPERAGHKLNVNSRFSGFAGFQ